MLSNPYQHLKDLPTVLSNPYLLLNDLSMCYLSPLPAPNGHVPGMADYSYIMPRPCGGPHTTTQPHRRSTTFPPLKQPNQAETEAQTEAQIMDQHLPSLIEGTSSQLYL